MERKERRAAAGVSFLTAQSLLELDLEETSSDSDFVPAEDQDDEKDDFNSDSESDEESVENSESDDDENDDTNIIKFTEENISLENLIAGTEQSQTVDVSSRTLIKQLKPICCACLGERSDDTNEIVECDGCGLTVHEACYGISESGSISSAASSCSTEPWFCEACKAGVVNPICELCPNVGGAYKGNLKEIQKQCLLNNTFHK